jgi:hypothetical protein
MSHCLSLEDSSLQLALNWVDCFPAGLIRVQDSGIWFLCCPVGLAGASGLLSDSFISSFLELECGLSTLGGWPTLISSLRLRIFNLIHVVTFSILGKVSKGGQPEWGLVQPVCPSLFSSLNSLLAPQLLGHKDSSTGFLWRKLSLGCFLSGRRLGQAPPPCPYLCPLPTLCLNDLRSVYIHLPAFRFFGRKMSVFLKL